MIHLKNIKEYTPDNVPEELAAIGVRFFISEDGEDFYEAIADLGLDTMKVLYRENYIVSFHQDASALYPGGTSLIEIPMKNIPKDLEIGEKYLLNTKTKKFTLNPEYADLELKYKKQALLAEVNEKTAEIQDKIDVGIATPEEEATLKAWKGYRIKVREATTVAELPAKLTV